MFVNIDGDLINLDRVTYIIQSEDDYSEIYFGVDDHLLVEISVDEVWKQIAQADGSFVTEEQGFRWHGK